MTSDSNIKHDVKMLILKRWNMDQTHQLFVSEYNRGEYISFHGYHFIEILSSSDDGDLFDVYQEAKSLEERAGEFSDIHTVQNITIIGDNTNQEFWDIESEFLGITFLQLVDSTDWQYDNIKGNLKKLFRENEKWALYYSLDFCDLVLFTKNIEINRFNDILWEVALIRQGKFEVVYDTFSIVSFSSDYIKRSFDNINAHLNDPSKVELQCQVKDWNESFSMSVNLTIKSIAALFELLNTLDNNKIPYSEQRLPGRYDVNIHFRDISSQQALMILYFIDQQAGRLKDNEYLPIGNYEVVFMAREWCKKESRNSFLSNEPVQNPRSFEKYILSRLNALVDISVVPQNNLDKYIGETYRAICELLNTGFSEEFMLSVFPSFVTFIELLREFDGFLEYEKVTTLDNSRKLLTKGYFTALNTLSQCTMHSERQFIHAPAFNANYFEIPPKLLAFYNALVCEIANTMSWNTGVDPYCYMITPDYRVDINVEPLHVNFACDTKRHLAIIHLPERYFYDPKKALMLLSHEVGHYEGDRMREERARAVFEMISLIMLLDTQLFHYDAFTTEVVSKESVLGVMSTELGGFFFTQFKKNNEVPNRNIHYHLIDLYQFLEDWDYCQQFFQNADSRREIIFRLRYGLSKVDFTDEVQVDILEKVLEEFDSKENTSYFSSLCDGDVAAAYESVSQCVVDTLFFNSVLANEDYSEKFTDMCATVIQSFSESFADMQMIRVIGDAFDLQDYKDLIGETNLSTGYGSGTILQDITVEQVIRYNAICKSFDFPLPDDRFQSDHLLTNTIIQSVSDYLQKCKDKSPIGYECKLKLQEYLEDDPFSQSKEINRTLYEYKSKMMEY